MQGKERSYRLCARNEAIEILITSRNGNGKIMQPI